MSSAPRTSSRRRSRPSSTWSSRPTATSASRISRWPYRCVRTSASAATPSGTRARRPWTSPCGTRGWTFRVQPGEGAFYGPKIEFTLHDSIGRAWQCGTIQVDFSMPGRLGAHYIAEDNSKQTPVMIHRAILGSMERFIGILIEHYAGALPAWLAPVQVVVCNITDRQAPFVREVTKPCAKRVSAAEFDLRNEKIGFKIREHTLQKVPYLLVLGDREVENRDRRCPRPQGAGSGHPGPRRLHVPSRARGRDPNPLTPGSTSGPASWRPCGEVGRFRLCDWRNRQ